MLTKRIRQLNRYREIVSIIAKYGYGYVIEDIGLHHLLNYQERMSHEFRASKEYGNPIRCLLEELGPTFIKMGQIVSIRSDYLPTDVIVELEKLQDHVPPVSIEEVRAIIEKELDQPIEDLFATFSETCMAAASIGQVHSAQLKTGETVVVKVQRPGIQKVIYN
ncbi:AarF/UbiB family protein [Mesobacillus maritimus]|uniref:ABC1 kinase family protein n=1 Tax=Mesobacillus maritimus TaxID=1643336 RepID=UPI002042302A|nr:AarF/UbiB family protein [Mesobacillus maritimus]MCM3584341.1 AarF/UbiB family protein [Mesobacillus maritimus]